MKNKNYFWVGYSDLMTSMFFIMMVLFIITVAVLQKQKEVTENILNEIRSVQKALSELDAEYFEFDGINKRYKLKIDANFPSNSDDINRIDSETKYQLVKAGMALQKKVLALIAENEDIDYLIIIEGNTQKNESNYIENPNLGYVLSYKRALALVNLWKENKVDFTTLGNQCEILIVGSGYFGKSRSMIEKENRRFTIQITSKFGKLID